MSTAADVLEGQLTMGGGCIEVDTQGGECRTFGPQCVIV